MPMLEAEEDWQQVQWELLNEFDFLSNSDEDEERTREVIRECEARLRHEPHGRPEVQR